MMARMENNNRNNSYNPYASGSQAGSRPSVRRAQQQKAAVATNRTAGRSASQRPVGQRTVGQRTANQGNPYASRGAYGQQASRGQQPRYNQYATGVGYGAAGVGGQDASAYSRVNYNTSYGNHGRGGNKGGKNKRFWNIVLVIAAVVLAVALGVLAVIGYGYWHGTKVYDQLAEDASIAKEASSLSGITVDWDSLRAQNEDIVGWVYVPGTSIDYPIVQGEDDSEYLYKDFTGDEGGIVHKGTIFLSADNASDFSDGNNFIYGHNMNDETMFAHILQMADQAAFDEARTVYILTPTENYRCQTFAIDIVANTDTYILQNNFDGASEMASYISSRIADSKVAAPTDIDISSMSKLFTLITCGDDYATTRAVLFAGCVERATPDNAQTATLSDAA